MFLTFGSIKMSEAGSYTAVVSNAVGSATSRPIVVTVIPPSQAPTIGQHPEDKMANVGSLVTFLVGATATGLEYQWRKNGVAIPGATSFAYSIQSVQPSDAGSYSVEVWNTIGRAVSRSATLTVGTSFPEIVTHPSDRRTSAGFSVELEVVARGTGLTYQWQRSGQDIPGATKAMLAFPVAQVGDSGIYRVTVSNASGSVRSNTATLTVLPPSEAIPPTRLANLSVRARLASASDVLIVGFVSGGSATKQFLLRGVGPGLRQFGVDAAAEATAVALFRSDGSLIFRESSWHPEWQQNVFPRVGAFPLPAGSRDGVIWLETGAGAYTAHLETVSGNGGEVLAAVYDMNPQGYPSRFLNLSARGRAGAGNSLIAGFVITGAGMHTVIVRGIGPTLTDIGVPDAIAAPQLWLRRTEATGSTIVASNSQWNFGLSDAFARAGAFPLRMNSRDTALMLPLAPGAYTAELTNSAAAAGTALIEVYDAR